MAGTIERRGKNSWRFGVQVETENGYEWIRDTISFPPSMSESKQRKQVEIALARLVVDIDAGLVKPTRRDHTVETFSALWLQEYVIPKLSANQHKTYDNFLRVRILPALGGLKLKKLTPMILTKFINDLLDSPRRSTRLPDEKLVNKRSPSDENKMTKDPGKTLSPRTVLHYYECLESMLSKAVQWDFLRSNPMDRVDRPKVPKTKPQYLTEERAIALLRCLAKEEDMSFRAAVLLAIVCGLRLGEVGALRLNDVDWRNGTIDISRALKYTPQTGHFEGDPKSEAGKRLIALPPGMMAVLHEEKNYQQDIAERIGDQWVGEGWIVHGWNGARLAHDTPSKQFRRFADKNGFQGVKFHSLRHTHATLLLANNIDAVAVATRMGHGDATVTLRTYAHALRRRDVDAARVIGSFLDDSGISFAAISPPVLNASTRTGDEESPPPPPEISPPCEEPPAPPPEAPPPA